MAPLTGKVPGNGTGTLTYTIPAAGLDVESVYVPIDNTGATSAVTAELTITDQSGAVIAKRQQTTTIPAGQSGSATWALRLADDSAGTVSPASSFSEAVILLGVDAYYKLDETSGTVARDSSGNGYDATVVPTYSAPVWNVSGGPLGTPAARFSRGSPFDPGPTVGFQSAHTFPAPSACTFLGWINRLDSDTSYLLTFGRPADGSIIGAASFWATSIVANANKFGLVAGNGSSEVEIYGDVAYPFPGTWHFIAATWNGSAWHHYVDGVQQASTTGQSPGASGQLLRMGVYQGSSGNTGSYADMQHLAYYGSQALSAAQIAALYALAIA